ncbi:gamma-glutamyltranspeptidase / glutathione hydrolase [Desulfacinum hydrothermale DSM 13146]|uniref:Gamma-glutamyltranspeptidase / glutathione hydrolase n=1 Tax=Desulfacinum hydrothermale DSM 13146 TaxID=1121390 RepID=A0A1W1X9G1_9BACT|nr:gamma-glutamyltransferase family protein [Desulfacinum hydrothermale]SMC20298.1 gamma-glutamyltranspeptidase / glutathione hydrolase [Desulfacinum hydrothermale DSM 13146]
MREFGSGSVQKAHLQPVQGFRWAVATEHYLSAQAAAAILHEGGNAFDAAAAATFVEGLVNPHMFTLGGECPMLVYSAADRRVFSINGNTQAPRRATLEAYRKRGWDLLPPRGVEVAGTPAAVAALLDMLARFGRLPLEVIVQPALQLASEGFPVHLGLVHMPKFGIQENASLFADQWPASARLYLSANDEPLQVGSRFTNTAYAQVLDALAQAATSHGRDRPGGIQAARDLFYRGDMAREMERFVRERDGFLTMEDLAEYETLFEEPIFVDFRHTRVFKCGPWSQGPVFLQMLRLLEGFHLESLEPNSADYLHIWTEAAKLAFADREQYYSDPRFVDVPLDRLLSPEYSEKRRALIDRRRASSEHRPGDPVGGKALLDPDRIFFWDSWGYGTVHVAVADGDGNLAALTPSGGWISGNEVVPSLGFPLGTRLQTFYLDPAHPNVAAPRKRPRTTLSPSLAFRNGRPWMAFGTMGGDQQDQWTLQFFLNRTVFGMDIQEALETPKVCSDHFPGTFHPHEAQPGTLRMECRIPEATRKELEARGHLIQVTEPWILGFICAVAREDAGLLEAGADPRGHRGAVFPSCALAL